MQFAYNKASTHTGVMQNCAMSCPRDLGVPFFLSSVWRSCRLYNSPFLLLLLLLLLLTLFIAACTSSPPKHFSHPQSARLPQAKTLHFIDQSIGHEEIS